MQGQYLYRLDAKDAGALGAFFERLEGAKEGLGVTDVSIGNATLDDVFIEQTGSSLEGSGGASDEDDAEQ